MLELWLGTWFLSALTTSICAILRGWSAFSWFLIGAMLPGVGIILVNALPESKTKS